MNSSECKKWRLVHDHVSINNRLSFITRPASQLPVRAENQKEIIGEIESDIFEICLGI